MSRPTIQLGGSAGYVEELWASKPARLELEQALSSYVRHRRWFRSKARSIVSVTVKDAIALGGEGGAQLFFVHVAFREGDPETYLLPLAVATGDEARELELGSPQAIVARIAPLAGGVESLLYDAVYGKQFAGQLLGLVSRKRELPGAHGTLRSSPEKELRQSRPDLALRAQVSAAEQSNTSLVFGTQYICKLFRKLDNGQNPELEISRALTEHGDFPNAPSLLGVLEYQAGKQEPATLATLHRYVSNQGDAWDLTKNVLERFFERCLALPREQFESSPLAYTTRERAGQLGGSLLQRARGTMPGPFAELVDVYPQQVRLLGQRTAELHRALSTLQEPAFRSEPFNTMYQRSLYESTRTRLKRALVALRKQRDSFDEHSRAVADEILRRQAEFDAVLRRLVDTKMDVLKIRIHGDYHLGQVLFTGKDFIIIDFEGEPGRSLAERRFKHSALRDVASMLRSLDYAALSALRTGALRASDAERLEPFARAWSAWMSAAFLQSYLATLDKDTGLVPALDEQTSALLEFYLLDKCLYELDYEFNNRPDWVSIPLLGLLGLLGGRDHDASAGRGEPAEPAPPSTPEPKSAGSIT